MYNVITLSPILFLFSFLGSSSYILFPAGKVRYPAFPRASRQNAVPWRHSSTFSGSVICSAFPCHDAFIRQSVAFSIQGEFSYPLRPGEKPSAPLCQNHRTPAMPADPKSSTEGIQNAEIASRHFTYRLPESLFWWEFNGGFPQS